MKKLPIAAAALLFGTSAYAMVPSTEPTGVVVDKDPYSVMGTSAVTTAGASFKLQPAAADWWDEAEPVAYKTEDAGLSNIELAKADSVEKADFELASSDEFAATDEEWEAAATAKAEAEGDPALDSAVGEPDPVAAETSALDEEPVPVENGVGGPYEGVDTAAALTPRPASQNYPACNPGPGDDRCIQLYEPGVREQLASWDQSTGGFAGTADTQVAMGGPYEPVADSATETERLNQQALAASESALQNAQMAAAAPVEAADESMIETAEAEAQDAALVHQASLDEEADTALDESLDDEKPVEV